MISAAGGVEESIVARIRCGWKMFRKLYCFLYGIEAVKEEDLAEKKWHDNGTVDVACDTEE